MPSGAAGTNRLTPEIQLEIKLKVSTIENRSLARTSFKCFSKKEQLDLVINCQNPRTGDCS